jgi:uncharacterized protein (UPF0276 family)
MPATRYNNFSRLGVGIGLRKPHHKYILTNFPEVEWFEIIAENFLSEGGKSFEVLEKIIAHYQVVMHGVSLYFGSPEMPPRDHLLQLKRLVRRTKTPWLTDHLCWGSVDGTYSHDLLPLPYTKEVARYTAQKIRSIRDFLEVPIAVENVSSYAEYALSSMTEWEFLNEVADQADCGILLDVNNVYVSARNHGFDAYQYLETIDPNRVVQIHIAGHCDKGKFIIDTHDGPPVDPVWDLYARAIELCGHTPTLLEWDSKIPSFEVVHTEAIKARRWLDRLTAQVLDVACSVDEVDYDR